jgi:hypothetical protein
MPAISNDKTAAVVAPEQLKEIFLALLTWSDAGIITAQ